MQGSQPVGRAVAPLRACAMSRRLKAAVAVAMIDGQA
jgi:hypothetical protein